MDDGEILRSIWFDQYNTLNHTNRGQSPYPRWDGGQDIDGRRYTRKWDSWAAVIRDAGLSIPDYVIASFQSSFLESPADIANAEAVRRFSERKATSRELQRSWNTQEAQLLAFIAMKQKMGMSTDRAVRCAIHNKALGVDPLVRYAFAKLNGVPCEDLREAAYLQYVEKRLWYDCQCRDRIPEEFRGK